MEVDIDLSALEIQENKRSHDELDSPNTSLDLGHKEGEVDQLRRSERKKIRPAENTEKRRVLTRPRKLNINSTMKEIENYYLDKKIKTTSPALETIFEEPKRNELMSSRKLRRCITFNDMVNEKPDKAKVKKRSMKAKKVNRFKKSAKKIGLELLMSKLKDLDNNEG